MNDVITVNFTRNEEGELKSENHYVQDKLVKTIEYKDSNTSITTKYNNNIIVKITTQQTERFDNVEVTNFIVKSIKCKGKIVIKTHITKFNKNGDIERYISYKNGVLHRSIYNQYDKENRLCTKTTEHYQSVFKYNTDSPNATVIKIITKYDHGKVIKKNILDHTKENIRTQLISKDVDGEKVFIQKVYHNNLLMYVTENDKIVESYSYDVKGKIYLDLVYDRMTEYYYSDEGYLMKTVSYKSNK